MINTKKEAGQVVIHPALVLVPHKNHVISLEVKNVDGRVNKRTLPLVLNKLKNIKNKFTKIIPKKWMDFSNLAKSTSCKEIR